MASSQTSSSAGAPPVRWQNAGVVSADTTATIKTKITKQKSLFTRKNGIIAAVAAAIAIVLIAVIAFLFGYKSNGSSSTPGWPGQDCSYHCSHENQSKLGEICSPSPLGEYKQYAVSTDSNVCAPAGKNIMDAGGNAVDAAISVLLCMGVTIPDSMGLGGGSLIVIYNGKTKKSTFINARETAPAAAHRDMYNKSGVHTDKASLGVEAIAVPGELAGYWRMFESHGSGKVAWNQLFDDAIHFAEKGFPVGHYLHFAIERNREIIMSVNQLRKAYTNPSTGELYKEGEIMVQPKLAETLRELANSNNPMETFYHTIAKRIIDDLNTVNAKDFKDQTPVITLSDFNNYQVIEGPTYMHKFKNDLMLHTIKLPGSGHLLSFILRIMLKFEELYPHARNDQQLANLFFHRLTESYKFAFANRMYLGDDRFDDVTGVIANVTSEDFINIIVEKISNNQTYPSSSGFYDPKVQYNGIDQGTAHCSVLDGEGNAVSVTSTVNLYFGSKVISPSTGIILNNEMDDFNTGGPNSFGVPPSHANSVQPGKRPLSSMSAAVFTDNTGVRLVVGASGGPKILTSVAYTSLRHLWMEDNIKQTIDSCRLHDQLFPEQVLNEPCFPPVIIEAMKQRKHNITEIPKEVRRAIVMGISRSRDGVIQANSDYRKGGTVAGA